MYELLLLLLLLLVVVVVVLLLLEQLLALGYIARLLVRLFAQIVELF